MTAPDDIGLLSAICRWFADQGISIEAAGIETADGMANDVFLVDAECDTDRLAAHLSRDRETTARVRATPPPRPERLLSATSGEWETRSIPFFVSKLSGRPARTQEVGVAGTHKGLRRLRLGVLLVATVIGLGTAGYVALGMSPLDALYQTVTTITTVGFREVEPFGAAEQWFTIAVIVGGVGTVLYTFTLAVQLVVEGQLGEYVGRRRMDRRIASMEGHVIVCGWGRVGRAVAHDLRATGRDVVVVDADPSRVVGVPFPTVVADATLDDTLRAAGITAPGRSSPRSPATPRTCSSRCPAGPSTRRCSSWPGPGRRTAWPSSARPAPTGSSTRRSSARHGWRRSSCDRTSPSTSTS